uniref:Uncharacterized protein n=1 Tax=viral metagenome TaxID=1070528 RepID=A0A6M3XRZ2_9ZZZZ
MPKYLRQTGSGHIYHWTPALAKRPDMVPYDEETARIRMEQLQRRLAEIKARKEAGEKVTAGNPNITMIEQAKELANLETEVERLENEERVADEAKAMEEALGKGDVKAEGKTLTAEEIEAEAKEKKIETDPQVRAIRAMDSTDDIEAYMLQEFGENIDKRRSLKSLKEYAEMKRIDRMFEK